MPAFPTPPLDSARDMVLAARAVLASRQPSIGSDPFSRLQRTVSDPSAHLARQFEDCFGAPDTTLNSN